MQFDMRHHMHFHCLLKNLPMKVFQVTSPNFNAIVESWKDQHLELNRWNLSSQHATPTAASFLQVPIKCPQICLSLAKPSSFGAKFNAGHFLRLEKSFGLFQTKPKHKLLGMVGLVTSYILTESSQSTNFW